MTSYELPIVGIRFQKGSYAALFNARGGSIVALRREPSNPHDSNAVAIQVDGVRVGYIPANHAGPLSVLMDSGKTIAATLDMGGRSVHIEGVSE